MYRPESYSVCNKLQQLSVYLNVLCQLKWELCNRGSKDEMNRCRRIEHKNEQCLDKLWWSIYEEACSLFSCLCMCWRGTRIVIHLHKRWHIEFQLLKANYWYLMESHASHLYMPLIEGEPVVPRVYFVLKLVAVVFPASSKQVCYQYCVRQIAVVERYSYWLTVPSEDYWRMTYFIDQ